MSRVRIRRLVGAAALALVTAGAVLSAELDDWSVEWGTMAGHHSNFFFRAEGQPAPAENLRTLYSLGGIELDLGKGDLELSYDARAVFTTEIERSQYQEYELESSYEIARTEMFATYGLAPNRVYSDEAIPTFYDQDWWAAEVRQEIVQGLWVGAEYEKKRWSFDPPQEGRDATSRGFKGTLRVPLGSWAGLRGSVMREVKEAREPDHSWSGGGYGISLEARSLDRFNLFLRYERTERSYEDAPVGDSNFRREDTHHDVLLNLQWRAGRYWGFRAEDSYRRGESTRDDRNFDGNEFSAGVYVYLGPETDRSLRPRKWSPS